MIEIALYVDGSCTNNGKEDPQMGAGVRAVCISNGKTKEYSLSLGPGTNNLAEILAVEEGLKRILSRRISTSVTIYSDSTYAIGVLTGRFKAKVNREHVDRIKALMTQFKEIEFKKVKSHSGHVGNNSADSLAKKGVKWKT